VLTALYPPGSTCAKAVFILMVFAGRTVHCTPFALRHLTRFRMLASEHEAFASAFASFGGFSLNDLKVNK
jgi:hypothetical protein